MKTKLIAIATIAALASSFGHAATFGVGDSIPMASVEDGGLASVSGDSVEYSKWSTSDIKSDGTLVIVAKAGRAGVDDLIKDEFTAELGKKTDLLTIVNKDDSAFGTGMFVEGAIEEGMLKNPSSMVVLDREGDLFSELEFQEESAALIVVKDGKVAYLKEGLIDAAEESKIFDLIK